MLALRPAAPRLAGNWEGLGLGNAFMAGNGSLIAGPAQSSSSEQHPGVLLTPSGKLCRRHPLLLFAELAKGLLT